MTVSVSAMQRVMKSQLPTEQKVAILMKANQKKSLLERGKEYLNANLGRFKTYEMSDNFKKIANGTDSVGKVESMLQTQIAAVKDLQIPESEKSLVLYTCDSLINELIFLEFKNGKRSDYVPLKERKEHQMIIKAHDLGLDFDKVQNSVYNEIRDPFNPSVRYRYQDDRKVEDNLENMSRSRFREDAVSDLRSSAKDPIYGKQNTAPVKQGQDIYVNLENPTSKFIADVFNKAMDKFSKEEIRKDTSGLFNFVKNSLGLKTVETYPLLHRLVNKCVYDIMEYGHEFQMKSMASKQAGEEMVR